MKRLSDTSTLEEDMIAAIQVLEIRMRDAERATRKVNARLEKLRALTIAVEQQVIELTIKNFRSM